MRPLTIERRWMFWLLVGLVILPTIALVVYGLRGLKSQSDAAEGRLRERFALQAAALEQGVLQHLGDEDQTLRRALVAVEDDGLADALARQVTPGSVVDAAWVLSDPALGDLLPSGAIDEVLPTLDAATPMVFLSGLDGSTIAVSRVGPGRIIAYRLNVAAIDAVVIPRLVGTLFPTEAATYRLSRVRREATAVSLDALREELSTRVSEADLAHPMATPFDGWRILVTRRDDAQGTSTTWTVVAMLVLATLIVTGITLMARAVAEHVRLARLQTEFVANVSHELRTPLASIRLFVETLQSGRVTDPERVAECLEIIADETERLTRKIERVLSWARLEAGRRLYDMEPLRPQRVVDASLAAFAAVQLDRPAEVAVVVQDPLPKVHGDLDALVEVFLNLLANARKYGGTVIRVEAKAERGGVSIAVVDNGPGIPSAERQRIFEKFYRPDLLQTRRAEGNGLGLAIVKAIVVAHHGKVGVESEPGRGARFTVWLPGA